VGHCLWDSAPIEIALRDFGFSGAQVGGSRLGCAARRDKRARMIERYSDHAANERTFLAWIRTAIAVMAFGFLVERFDLFLQIAGQTLARRALSSGGQIAGNIAGLALIALGAAIIVIALLRFLRTAREIDSPERLPGSGERLDVALAALLAILGTALFVYLSYTVISRL
jgi:putative membrane protein